MAILIFISYAKIGKEDCSKEKKADIKCLETSRFRTAYIDLAVILLSEEWATKNEKLLVCLQMNVGGRVFHFQPAMPETVWREGLKYRIMTATSMLSFLILASLSWGISI